MKSHKRLQFGVAKTCPSKLLIALGGLVLPLLGCFGQPAKPGAEEIERGRGGGSQAAKTRGADGVEIAYTVYGEGERMLVLVHGFGGSQQIWASQVDDLAQRYTVLTVDLSGHGLSGRGRPAAGLRGLAGDLVAVFDAAGARQAVVVGHSMGGAVALLAARERPQAVRALIGVEAFHYPPLDPAIWRDLFGQLEADFPAACRSFLRGLFAAATEEPLVEETAAGACLIEPAFGLALLRDLAAFDLEKALAALPPAMPLRSIEASEEPEPPPPASEPLQRFHADFKTGIIARSGHFPMLEQSAELTRQLAAALKEIEAKR